MISHGGGDLFHAHPGRGKEVLCPLKPDLLQESRVSKPGLALDQPVEVIFLKMKCIRQILDLNVRMILSDIRGNLLEDDPVHRLPLVLREGEVVFGADDREDAKEQPLADMAGADAALIKLLEKPEKAVFKLRAGVDIRPEMQVLLEILLFQQGGLQE